MITGPHLASSLPKPTGGNLKKDRKATQSINILNIIAQSTVNKKAEFKNLVNSTGADVVVITETWLKEGIHQDSEIGDVGGFNSNYKIYRRDRKDGYGGVLVAVRMEIVSKTVQELENRGSDNIGYKVKIAGLRPMYRYI